jgi:hypothetical protein
MIVEDSRSGVFQIYDSTGRLFVIWSNCYRINRALQPEETEVRRRVRIHRGKHGCPILIPRRGQRSSFLTGKTLCRFEEETRLVCKMTSLQDLNTMALSECGRPWRELTAKERLQILEWLAEG